MVKYKTAPLKAGDYSSTFSCRQMAKELGLFLGSLFLVEAADRATVETFNRADPFRSAGIWETVEITRCIRRQG
jgi:hypothetical protein